MCLLLLSIYDIRLGYSTCCICSLEYSLSYMSRVSSLSSLIEYLFSSVFFLFPCLLSCCCSTLLLLSFLVLFFSFFLTLFADGGWNFLRFVFSVFRLFSWLMYPSVVEATPTPRMQRTGHIFTFSTISVMHGTEDVSNILTRIPIVSPFKRERNPEGTIPWRCY